MFISFCVILFLFNYSALQLTDDAIHLSLSPTRMTTPPSAGNNLNNNGVLNVTASTDLTTLTKLSNGNNTVLRKRNYQTEIWVITTSLHLEKFPALKWQNQICNAQLVGTMVSLVVSSQSGASWGRISHLIYRTRLKVRSSISSNLVTVN